MSNDEIEKNYLQVIRDLMERVSALEKKELTASSLSEITPDLGRCDAGMILVHADYLDPHDIGDGFSGLLLIGEGVDINGVRYALVGYKVDTPMFAVSAETGEAFFCIGNAVINADGITGTDLLKWMIRQIASNDVYTRTGKLGMALKEGGGTIPVWQMSYENEDDAGVELATNGDFETGDFTGWTKTTETNGSWGINDDVDYVIDGVYSIAFSASDVNQSGVLTGDRITGIADKNIEFSGKINIPGISSGTRLAKIEIKWYDHASAGSLLQTDILGQITSTAAHGLFSYSSIISAPAGALSCAIVITNQKSEIEGAIFYDSISVKEVAVNQKFWLEDDGVGASGVTSDTTSALSSGLYTPTTTAGANTNVQAVTFSDAMWTRIGNVVHVAGYAMLDPTANANTVLSISLPIASNFTAASDCAGTGKIIANNTTGNGSVYADATNDLALLRFAQSGTTSNTAIVYHFTYLIK